MQLKGWPTLRETGVWLCLALLCAGCQEFKAEKTGQVYAAQSSVDVGRVLAGETIVHTFEVLNQTEKEVVLGTPKAPCGCTATTLASGSLPAGGSVQVQVQVRTNEHQLGPKSEEVLVVDELGGPLAKLSIRAFVYADSLVVKPSSIDVGSIVAGDTGVAKVYISDPTYRNFRIREVGASSELLEVEWSAMAGTNVPTYEVTIQVTGGDVLGAFTETVTVFTGAPDLPSIPIVVSGKVKPPLAAYPDRAFFGKVPRGSNPKQLLEVRANRPFAIRSITTDLDGVKWHHDSPPGTSHSIAVSLDTTHVGLIKGTIKIGTDLESSTPLRIPVYAQITEES